MKDCVYAGQGHDFIVACSLDHDVFSSNRAKDMNVIDFNKTEHDVSQKPVPTFWHHALATFMLSRPGGPCRSTHGLAGGALGRPFDKLRPPSTRARCARLRTRHVGALIHPRAEPARRAVSKHARPCRRCPGPPLRQAQGRPPSTRARCARLSDCVGSRVVFPLSTRLAVPVSRVKASADALPLARLAALTRGPGAGTLVP